MINEDLTKLFSSTINFYDITRTSLCTYCRYGCQATCGSHICDNKESPKEGLLTCVQSCNHFELDPNVLNWDVICKTCEHCSWVHNYVWGMDFPQCEYKARVYTHDTEMCNLYEPNTLFIKEKEVK